eukprot:3790759-Prymnesium_polylepis.2
MHSSSSRTASNAGEHDEPNGPSSAVQRVVSERESHAVSFGQHACTTYRADAMAASASERARARVSGGVRAGEARTGLAVGVAAE